MWSMVRFVDVGCLGGVPNERRTAPCSRRNRFAFILLAVICSFVYKHRPIVSIAQMLVMYKVTRVANLLFVTRICCVAQGMSYLAGNLLLYMVTRGRSIRWHELAHSTACTESILGVCLLCKFGELAVLSHLFKTGSPMCSAYSIDNLAVI